MARRWAKKKIPFDKMGDYKQKQETWWAWDKKHSDYEYQSSVQMVVEAGDGKWSLARNHQRQILT